MSNLVKLRLMLVNSILFMLLKELLRPFIGVRTKFTPQFQFEGQIFKVAGFPCEGKECRTSHRSVWNVNSFVKVRAVRYVMGLDGY